MVSDVTIATDRIVDVIPARPARPEDVEVLGDIERAAGRMFAAIGMDAVADDEPLPADTLRRFVDDARAWVVPGGDDVAVGYALVAELDGVAHLEQVSVRPEHGGRGLGTALLERVLRWARERGAPAITLTTFVDVAWNGPYYLRRGFRYLDDAELTPGLLAIRAAEAAHGLDRWPRACMRRDLTR